MSSMSNRPRKSTQLRLIPLEDRLTPTAGWNSNPTPPTPTANLDLGVAGGYNAFVFGNFDSKFTETEGRLAVGGSASLQGYSVGVQLSNSSGRRDDLIVGGNLTYLNGQSFTGNIVYGGSANLTSVGHPNGSIRKGSAIDFASAEAQLDARSDDFSRLPANGSAVKQYGNLTLTGTNPLRNVFDLSAADFNDTWSLSVNVPKDSVVVINVFGSFVSMKYFGIQLNGTDASKVLFNFPGAQTLQLAGIGVEGSVLAPRAQVQFDNGDLRGTLVAKSFAGTGEIRYVPPNLCVDVPASAPISAGTGLPSTKLIAVGSGAGEAPTVRVYNLDGSLRFTIDAYAPNVTTGIRVATGDVNGDGVDDIITAPGVGGGPNVKVFDGVTGKEIMSFYAYAPDFAGGVFVAAGDVNGDGYADIITGAGAGGGPHVKIFDGKTGDEARSFYAYGTNYTGGVSVAEGDINGDGRADIVTGTGPGYAAHVRAFDGVTLQELRSFYAYSPSFTGGISVAVGDVNGDGVQDIVTAAGPGGGPHVQAFDGRTGQLVASFFAGTSGVTTGVSLSVKDVNGDGIADFLTGVADPSGSKLTVYSGADGSVLEQFLPFGAGNQQKFTIG